MHQSRSPVNKDVEAGMNNRQWGMCTKADALHRGYNADVIVVIRRPDGRIGGYQSRSGLLDELMPNLGDQLLSPSDVVKQRSHRGLGVRQKSTDADSASSVSTPSSASFFPDLFSPSPAKENTTEKKHLYCASSSTRAPVANMEPLETPLHHPIPKTHKTNEAILSLLNRFI